MEKIVKYKVPLIGGGSGAVHPRMQFHDNIVYCEGIVTCNRLLSELVGGAVVILTLKLYVEFYVKYGLFCVALILSILVTCVLSVTAVVCFIYNPSCVNILISKFSTDT